MIGMVGRLSENPSDKVDDNINAIMDRMDTIFLIGFRKINSWMVVRLPIEFKVLSYTSETLL